MDSENLNKLIEIIGNLVAFRSVSSGSDVIKEDLINFIEHIAQSGGLQTYKFYKNGKPSMLVYHPDKGDFNFSLLLHGHIDVVHGHESQYVIDVKNDEIHGRGTLDMKSSVAVFLLLMENLQKVSRLPKDIGLMLTSDEEQGGENGTKYLFAEEKIRADFFITGEPTDLHIVNQHKGVWRASIGVGGVSSHSSTPWLSDNPIDKITKYISEFIQNNPLPGEDEWKSTYSFNKIESGDSINKVPETAKAWIDIRYTIEEELFVLKNEINRYFPDSTIDLIFSTPPVYTEEDNPNILRLNQRIEEVTGNQSEIRRKEYSTDARYASMHNIPAVVFGPSGKGIHEHDEYVEIESLKKYYEILWKYCVDFEDSRKVT